MTTILLVEDDHDTARLLSDVLGKRTYHVSAVHSGETCLSWLRSQQADLVIADVQMPGIDGLELCRRIQKDWPSVPVIVLTAQVNVETAVAAIRAGAYDFVTKPMKLDALVIAVERALQRVTLQREVARLRQAASAAREDGEIVGESSAVRTMVELIERVAPSDATVLITGESGTGKELVARALHDRSPRHGEPFVAINCAAMPPALLESELFGHVRGAFTDAKQSRVGLFVQAGRGTIFLDEIGEMPLDMQAKLLRVLQERRVRPVGSDEETPFQARVVAATNRSLENEVAEKRFREDLYYRINVVSVDVPALRARTSDILLLAQVFVQRAAKRLGKPVRGITSAAATLMLEYDWPGNVRELENCIERAVALCRLDELTIDDMPQRLGDRAREQIVMEAATPAELITLEEMERRYVRTVLAAAGGNKTHAARILGIDRRSLYRRLEDRPSTSPPPSEDPAGESTVAA